MSFLSDASYWGYLEERIRSLEDTTAREYVTKRFEQWRRQYGDWRLVERAAEMLAAELQRPNVLYLHDEADVNLLRSLAQRHRFDGRVFRGFLVSDTLRSRVQPQWFSPFPVYCVSDWQDTENTAVLSLSQTDPLRNNGRDKGNDYLECFIDLSGMSEGAEIRRRSSDRRIVLYADYRKVQTLAAIAGEVRKSSDLATVLLVNEANSCGSEFDAVIEQPAYYLWPLVFKTLAPDLYHVNVGWGTQGLPFAPFLPKEAIIDFYDLLAFVRDDALDGHHAEPLALTRASEKTFLSGFNRIIHRCSDDISASLSRIYPGRDIVSVTEYLREPVYAPAPARRDGTIRLVYGGLLVQDGANPDDPHYKSLLRMAQYYCQGNLHLYLYPSPYLYGFGAPKGLEELIARLGLSNVHACMPLAENDFVRQIVGYDFGMCIPTPEEVRPTSYGYILPGKIIAYLRAGLPIVVPEDQTFIADLVREHGIGVVYGYDDVDRMADLLNGQDIDRLKQNVVRFREQFRIDKAAKKVLALYDSALKPQAELIVDCGLRIADSPRPSDSLSVVHPSTAGTDSHWKELIDRLCRFGFLGAREYQELLEQEVRAVFSGKALQHVSNKLQSWLGAYTQWRCLSRLLELIAELRGTPYCLYLDGPAGVNLLPRFLHSLREAGLPGPGGFIVAPELESLKAQVSSCPVYGLGDAVPDEFTVIGLAGERFPGNCRKVVLNDYLERFIDSRRFDNVREILRRHDGRQVILYPLYREIHTVSIMAKFIRRQEDGIRSICLSPAPLIDAGFDESLVEPSFYLWPLVFRMIDPEIVHLNVGWGIQALPFSAFLPDRRRAVIDFYEVLSFLPDVYFEKTHSRAEQVRLAEEHFFANYDHIMHMCSEETSTKLARKYGNKGGIVSVTECLQEPTYSVPPRNDGEIRLVYGGCMLATTNPDDLYYRAFVKVAPYFARENVHLYIYNSPYVHGMVENDGLKEVIQRLGLTNAHACTPRKQEEFVREISQYDYGTTLLRPKDMNAVEYNYFMAYKFLTYLRAGLPIIIDADNHFMADLVTRYNIGIVLQDDDLERLPEILSHADLPALKRNVVKFRGEFSIDKGGAKVLGLYRDILNRSDRRRVSVPGPAEPVENRPAAHPPVPVRQAPAFEEMIRCIAAAENRLYYRDQSAATMSSLACCAQELNPSVIVELGTLAGLSLRAWIAAAPQAKIYAVDLSFKTLHETAQILPLDLSRVTLVEQDILQTDLAALWKPQDRVILFVDAHDLPNVPIMEHVLRTAVPLLPDGSMVIVDDLWFSEQRVTQDNARSFLESRVLGEIDELQCFHGHYAPYHKGGSFMGFAEVSPLLKFVNRYGIELIHDKGGKHVCFTWRRECLLHTPACGADDLAESEGLCGSVLYNPMESVPTAAPLAETMRQVADMYLRRELRGVAECLSEVLRQYPQDESVSYGLAVCLARSGMLSQSRDLLARTVNQSSHPRCRHLLDNLVQRVGSPRPFAVDRPQQKPEERGLTIFAMPKAFTGHTAVIQKNAIRSWATLNPRPEIILFGNEPGIREMAQEVGAKHIPDIQRNEYGTPRVDTLFQAGQEHASHEIMAYVNADMILGQDFIEAAQKVQAGLPEFLLIGRRWDLSLLDEIDFDQPLWREALVEQVKEHAMLHAECGLDYFVFRRGLYPQMPPFAIGRTAWDNWLVMDPNRRGIPVVDGTESILAVHQDHGYGHVAGGRHEAWAGTEAARNRELAGRTDNSGRTSGATWILREGGVLERTPPRQAWSLTDAYKDQRCTWLLNQIDRLITAGKEGLAVCKCEEATGILEGWLALKLKEHGPSESQEHVSAMNRYVAGFATLARFYMRMGHHDRVVAIYSWLLDNPTIGLPEDYHDRILKVRDQLVRYLEGGRRGTCPSEIDEGGAGRAMMTEAPVSAAVLPATGTGGKADNGLPAVTVITACRNAEQHLPACVDSIVNQTMGNWELFLLDDGSTDGTRRLIQGYARRDARIKAYCFDDNVGPYTRRNFAIEQARSPFIVIQDADDIMVPNKLERLYGAIAAEDRLGVVGSFYRMFLDPFQGVEHTEDILLTTSHEAILAEYRTSGVCDWCWHGSAIIRKRLFEEIGPYDENPFGSDSFWLAKATEYACRCGEVRLKNIPEFLTLRRMHARSQTGRLPSFDRRSRRVKFAEYRRRRLSELVDRLDVNPAADVRAELRNSVCNDFIKTHGHLFTQWEGEPLTSRMVDEFMTRILWHFFEGHFVRYIVTCGIVEQLVEGVAETVRCYDLLRGAAYFVLGLDEQSRDCLMREWATHGTLAARAFCSGYLDGNAPRRSRDERLRLVQDELLFGAPVHVAAAMPVVQSLLDRRQAGPVSLSLIIPYTDDPGQTQCTAAVNAQTAKDFEIIVLSPKASVAEAQTAAEGVQVGVAVLATRAPSSPWQQRNDAVAYARGRYIAFLGQGILPEPDFVARLLQAFNEHDISALRGRILSRHEEAPMRFDLGPETLHAICDADEMCAFRRDVFVRLGGYVETPYSRGAVQLSYRIHEEQDPIRCPILYCPDVVVHSQNAVEPRGYPVDPFALENRLCIGWLQRRGRLSNENQAETQAFFAFVAGLYSLRERTTEGQYAGFMAASAFFEKRLPAVAAASARKALECRPNSVKAQYLLGAACSGLNLPDLAVSHLEEVVEPLEALLAKGRLRSTQSEFRDYVGLQSCYTRVCILLAQCYMQLGRHERVLAAYRRLLANPSVHMPAGHRDDILRVCDSLARRLEAKELSPDPGAPRPPAQIEASTDPAHGLDLSVRPAAGPGPKVTVITVCHNSAPHLRQCVDSVLSQTASDWELLLVDDGSTDETGRIMEQYGRMDPRIQVARFDRCEGPYVRRRWAIARAESDFIAIHDSDDLMMPDKLERLYREIAGNPGLAVVGSFYRMFIDEFRGLPFTELVTLPTDPHEIVESCATWRHGFSHGSAIIRREMFAHVGPYDANPFGSDSFWSAKLGEFIRQGAPWRIGMIPEALTFTRVHATNQTQQVSMVDPRSRRTQYHQYCEYKLRAIRERTRGVPGADIGRELRECDCSDFLVRFRAAILRWESGPLDERLLPVLLGNAARLFQQGRYVSCLRLLNGIEAMQQDVAGRMVNFDLLRALALYALDLKELSVERLHEEVRHHGTPAARQFIRDCFQEASQVDMCRWVQDHVDSLNLEIREAGPAHNVSSCCPKNEEGGFRDLADQAIMSIDCASRGRMHAENVPELTEG